MTSVNISWYLCTVFAIATVVASAITVHPDAQSTMNWMLAGTAGFSLVFGTVAVILKRLDSPEPKWLDRVFQVLAVLGTLWAFALIGG